MRVFAITIALSMVLCTTTFSDVIRFRDGGKIEGIITEEAADYIVIDMGFGTMSVRRDEIDYIEWATDEERARLKRRKLGYEIDRGEWAPEGYENIRILYNEVKSNKAILQEGRSESQVMRAEISRSEQEISDLLDELAEKGRELKSIDAKKDVKKYNETVAEMNSINASLNKESNKIKVLYEKEKELGIKLAEMTSNYRNSFQLFKDALSSQEEAAEKLNSDEKYFFITMGNKASDMEGDFKEDVAVYKPEGGHIVVDAQLNESVSARLIVDTGASIVLISTAVADQLGIRHDDTHTQMEIMMADGRSVEAKPIILESIKVGNAEVKNVQGAILDSDAIGTADGLLGMSFLSHFVIKVDSAANKLILERVL